MSKKLKSYVIVIMLLFSSVPLTVQLMIDSVEANVGGVCWNRWEAPDGYYANRFFENKISEGRYLYVGGGDGNVSVLWKIDPDDMTDVANWTCSEADSADYYKFNVGRTYGYACIGDPVDTLYLINLTDMSEIDTWEPSELNYPSAICEGLGGTYVYVLYKDEVTAPNGTITKIEIDGMNYVSNYTFTSEHDFVSYAFADEDQIYFLANINDEEDAYVFSLNCTSMDIQYEQTFTGLYGFSLSSDNDYVVLGGYENVTLMNMTLDYLDSWSTGNDDEYYIVSAYDVLLFGNSPDGDFNGTSGYFYDYDLTQLGTWETGENGDVCIGAISSDPYGNFYVPFYNIDDDYGGIVKVITDFSGDSIDTVWEYEESDATLGGYVADVYGDFAVLGLWNLTEDSLYSMDLINTTSGTAFDIILMSGEEYDELTISDTVFVYEIDGVNLTALYPTNGSSMWTYEADCYWIANIDSNSEMVVFTCNYDSPCYVMALNASTGAELWNYTAPSNPPTSLGNVVVGDDYVFFWDNSGDERTVVCLDAFDGTYQWNVSSNNYGYEMAYGGDSEVVILQYTEDEGETYDILAYNVTDGTNLWNFTDGEILDCLSYCSESNMFGFQDSMLQNYMILNEQGQELIRYDISPWTAEDLTLLGTTLVFTDNDWSVSGGNTYGVDYQTPSYSGAVGEMYAGEQCYFNATFTDEVALHPNGQWSFGTNNTGAWVYTSPQNFTSTPESNQTLITLNSTVGIAVAYRWNFTDNVGNYYNVTTASGELDNRDPEILGYGHTTSYAGQSINFTINANDTLALHPSGQAFLYTNNSGTWEYEDPVNFTATPEQLYLPLTLNSTVGLTIGWQINITDNDGGANQTSVYTLVTTDGDSPTYSGASNSTTEAGATCYFNLTVNDNNALESNGQYQFATNNTGTWVWDSAVNFTSTPESISVSKTLNVTDGLVVGYRWNFTDNQGNANYTAIYTVTISDSVAPTYATSTYSNTGLDAPCNFTIVVSDVSGLVGGGFIFSTNATGGTWSNSTWTAFDSNPYTAWNVTTLPLSEQTVIGWRWFTNDTQGNWGSSNIYTLTTDDAGLGGGGGGGGGDDGDDEPPVDDGDGDTGDGGSGGSGGIINLPQIIDNVVEAIRQVPPMAIWALVGTLGFVMFVSVINKTVGNKVDRYGRAPLREIEKVVNPTKRKNKKKENPKRSWKLFD